MRQSAPTVTAPRTAGRSARSGTRDLFVLCAMAVVVLALGLGLHLQFNVSGQSALITALAVWMGLLVMHLAVRRVHAVAAGTRADTETAAGNGVDLKRMSATAAPQPRSRATAPEEAPARPRPPPLPASARAPAARQAVAEPSHQTLQHDLRGSVDIQTPRPALEAPREERCLPPEMGWDLRPGVHPEPEMASGLRPALFPPIEPMPAPAARKDASPAPARFPHHSTAVDGGGTTQPRTTPPPSGGDVALDQNGQAPSTRADAKATELRSMQSIIDQLARQLKAPADAQPGMAEPPTAGLAESQAGTEQAISRSIQALKAAGGAMRAAQGEHGAIAARPEPIPVAGPAHPSIAEAVAGGGLEVCLDSILSLEDRKTRHFEISVRVRSGTGEPVTVDDYTLIQAGGGLRGRLDAAKLTRAARIAEPLSKRGLSASLFVGLAAESLVDDNFLDACANVLKSQPDIVHQLVPSFGQGEIRAFSKPHWDTLARLKENGLRFGLEGLADLAMDFAILRERGFHFVKIDAAVLLAGMQAHDGVVSALQVCRRVAEAGLDLIVGRIDDDATLAQVGGLGVLYGQGTFFGVPRPVKIDRKAQHEAAA